MSHPDPLFDPDNAYEDDDMMIEDENYDHHNDFWGLPENELDEIRNQMNEDEGYDEENDWDDSYDDSMDGDHESGLASAGFGTDEDYGDYGDDTSMYDDYYGGE